MSLPDLDMIPISELDCHALEADHATSCWAMTPSPDCGRPWRGSSCPTKTWTKRSACSHP